MLSQAKSVARHALQYTPVGRSVLLDSWSNTAQPKGAWAQCLISGLHETGTGNTGKVAKYLFFSVFCDALRRAGIRTHFCHSHLEVELRLRRRVPTVLINLFGEDDCQIASPRMQAIEDRCALVFNRAASGIVLADKVLSEECLMANGVRMPGAASGKEEVFVRKRTGSCMPTRVIHGTDAQIDEDEVGRAYIDTRVDYGGRSFFTALRAMCVSESVVAVSVRARPVEDEDPTVKIKATPLDPALIEHLNATLVDAKRDQIADHALRAFEALGHGFYAHDLMVQRGTGRVFMCESGFKFTEHTCESYFAPIKDSIPSQASIVSTKVYAGLAARAFVEHCRCAI